MSRCWRALARVPVLILVSVSTVLFTALVPMKLAVRARERRRTSRSPSAAPPSRRRRALARVPILILLSGSTVPFIVLVPMILAMRARESREVSPPPYPVPHVTLTAVERRQFTPLPPSQGTVPVLIYHDIGDLSQRPSTTRSQLAQELALLALLHYHTISIAAYDAWHAGRSAALPSRPILIAFDGGLRDSFRGADRALARYGMRATMFVDRRLEGTGTDAGVYLRADELARMQRSGRWQLRYGPAPRGSVGARTPHSSPGRPTVGYEMETTTSLPALYRYLAHPRPPPCSASRRCRARPALAAARRVN